VPVDADMVRRVLINLLENAVKFSPEKTAIQVAVQRQNGFVLTQVKDNGPGIPPAQQERIFEKFARLNMKDGPKGLGLGLAYCRLAIAAHGGQIWIESEPGQGSTFNFTLPSEDPTT
jgi:signal transduction histidine kinase